MENYMTRLLLTKTGLNILYRKCDIFKGMIENKNPERTDLIESFDNSKDECLEAMTFLEDLDREMRTLRQRNADLEFACQKMATEIHHLKNTNKNLIDRVEL